MNSELLCYSVGPLLYSPAANTSVAESLIHQAFGTGFSLALCLEDTIDDNCVEEAETILLKTLQLIENARTLETFDVPKIFIRVRKPEQISDLCKRMSSSRTLLSGFILPKFSLANADSYLEQIAAVNSNYDQTIYMMPILEDPAMLNLIHRYDILYRLKEKLDRVSRLVLNVRVGGNDLCHAFGFRRSSTDTIYDIRPVCGMLSDIMTVFGMDYVVSGPVWEYYDGVHWDKGLMRELQLDRLNGFVGKTVIHPKQIPLVKKAYMVSNADYQDALSILNWKPDTPLLVSGNTTKDRMNEYKTHYNWAKKIIALSQAYGIADAAFL